MEEEQDVKHVLSRIPQKHRELIKGFDIIFEPTTTLKGDKKHIGVVMTHPKKVIKVASPWRHSREFAFLHEIAHMVYEKFVRGTDSEKEWTKICAATKDKKKDESPEELWCHNYANYFCSYPVMIHNHETWIKYLKDFLEKNK